MGFQPAGTIVAHRLQGLEHFITWIMAGIVVFVSLLLLYVIFRFNRRANPKAATFTHNSPLEIAWTLIPIVILVVIGAYSLPVLFLEEEVPQHPDITVRVTGNQWYWHYDYMASDATNAKATFGFDSYMIGSPASITAADDKDGVKPYILNAAMKAKLAKAGYTPDEFKLAVDNPMVVPVGKTVVAEITGADVIHSWKVPAFGVMQDAVPGRLARIWFKADKEGIYFGQCSELCGKDHAFMPIEVKVVSEAEYQAWLAKAKQLFADAAPAAPQPVQVASAD
jgi:cytochrome c oxidase subunit 2